ncbi:MAG: Uma2 family endonuclease [Bacteroidota bacterium]
MGLPISTYKRYTVEEYLELSLNSTNRLEFESGLIVDMGRTTLIHSEIVVNTSTIFRQQVADKKCRVFVETVGLEVQEKDTYFLPDILITCHEEDLVANDMVRHPSLIVEVTSPESVSRDRNLKFQSYLKIPSLLYYIIIPQDQVRVEIFGKMESGRGWSFTFFESLDDTILLEKLALSFKVSDAYENIRLNQYK